MYVLKPNKKGRGFRLLHKKQQVFETTHLYNAPPVSSVTIETDEIEIRHFKETSEIFKNGKKIGAITYKKKNDILITLYRLDGGKDFFKLNAVVLSHYTLSTVNEKSLLKFQHMLSRVFFFNEFKVEVLSDLYPNEILEELMFYAGEVLYKRVEDDKNTKVDDKIWQKYRQVKLGL